MSRFLSTVLRSSGSVHYSSSMIRTQYEVLEVVSSNRSMYIWPTGRTRRPAAPFSRSDPGALPVMIRWTLVPSIVARSAAGRGSNRHPANTLYLFWLPVSICIHLYPFNHWGPPRAYMGFARGTTSLLSRIDICVWRIFAVLWLKRPEFRQAIRRTPVGIDRWSSHVLNCLYRTTATEYSV